MKIYVCIELYTLLIFVYKKISYYYQTFTQVSVKSWKEASIQYSINILTNNTNKQNKFNTISYTHAYMEIQKEVLHNNECKVRNTSK